MSPLMPFLPQVFLTKQVSREGIGSTLEDNQKGSGFFVHLASSSFRCRFQLSSPGGTGKAV